MPESPFHPDGSKLYVPQPGILNVYDAGTGALLSTIDDPVLSTPTGVCFPE